MRDTELQEHLGHPDFGLDGIWSVLTKTLLKKFSARQIELNKWWALTPQSWRCPSCDRQKEEIARLSDNGILLAKLVSHHDHAKEFVERYFSDLVAKGTESESDRKQREYLKKLAKGFLTRFEPTIICEDCNVQEAKLKAAYALPKFVTLSLDELKIMQTAKADAVSELSMRLRKWGENIEKHIRLAAETFDPILHFEYRRSRSAELFIIQHATFELNAKFGKTGFAATDLLEEFLIRSTAKPQTAFSKEKTLPFPTYAQFKSYVNPDRQRQKFWVATPDSWNCPICGRSKFGCFRSSSAKPSCFHGNLFPKGGDQIGAESANVDRVVICGDCNDFPLRFRQFLRGSDRKDLVERYSEEFLNASLIRAGLKAAPHQRHSFDFNACLERLLELDALEMGPCDL